MADSDDYVDRKKDEQNFTVKVKISRETFNRRLKDLQKDDWILKKKNVYELNFSKEDKKILKKEYAAMTKFERQVERSPTSNDPSGEGHKILTHVFNKLYVPLDWHYLCHKSGYSKNERHLIEEILKRYQKGMEKMVKKLYQLNHLQANFFLQSHEMFFIKKENN